MISEIMQRLGDVERRLANVITLGAIIAADYDNALVKVQAGGLITGWRPWLTRRASNDLDYWAPEVGEQVILLSPGGESEKAVVLPAIYQADHQSDLASPTVHRTTYSDGSVIEYDRGNHKLKAALVTGATTELVSTGGVAITGDVTVTGNVNVTKNITATLDITDGTRSMAGDRGIYNGHTHTGDSGGTTTAPGAAQ